MADLKFDSPELNSMFGGTKTSPSISPTKTGVKFDSPELNALFNPQKETNIVTPTPEITPPKKTFAEKYTNFSNKMGTLGAGLDIGLVRGAGMVLSPLQTMGEWLTKPLGKAIDKAMGVTEKEPTKNIQDYTDKWAETLDKHIDEKDKDYMYRVFEGVGSSVPFIAGGLAAKAAQVPIWISTLGLSGMEALVNANQDYRDLTKSGVSGKDATKKAVVSFGANMLVNTITNKLGFLSDLGGRNPLKKFVIDTLLETGQETAQQLISNITTGKKPGENLGDTFLVSLPISALLGGGAAIMSQKQKDAPEYKRTETLIKDLANENIKKNEIVDTITEVSGAEKEQVDKIVTTIINNNNDLSKKLNKSPEQIVDKVFEKVNTPQPEVEIIKKPEHLAIDKIAEKYIESEKDIITIKSEDIPKRTEELKQELITKFKEQYPEKPVTTEVETLLAEKAKQHVKEFVDIGEVSKTRVPQLVTKTQVKTFLEGSKQKSIDMKVVEENGKKYMTYETPTSSGKLRPSALGLIEDNIKTGETVRISEVDLKPKGTTLRAYKNGQVYGFNPKNLEELTTPKATKELNKIVKRSEIAKELSDKLGVPLRHGKFRFPGALGIYKKGPKVVRLKKGGLATVFHEVGHFLDDKFDFSKAINISERKELMKEYGASYDNQPRRQQEEAFAEFLRFKMTGQTGKALEAAPDFSKLFDKRMADLPEVKDVLDTATKDFQRWQEQPAVAKVLSNISFGAEKEGSLLDRTTSKLHDLYTIGVDDLHPLDEWTKLAGKVTADDNPYILARNLRGWIGKADTFLTKGTFGKKFWEITDGKTKPVFKGKSFQDIIKPIERAGKLDEFRAYLVSKRIVEDLAPRNITSGISTNDAKEAIKELELKNPEFDQESKDLYKYQDDLLEYAHEKGLVGSEGIKKIKEFNKFRVPFYRVMEEARSAYMGGKKIAGNLRSPIKKIKGSEREIIDPIESIIKDTYAIINATERNEIGISMANLSKTNFELARMFEKVDKPMMGTKVKLQEVLSKLDPELAKEMPEEFLDEAVTLFRPMQDMGNNMINVNMGDKTHVFQVEPDLFKALQGLNSEDTGMIMRILSIPARLLRAGATLSPDFALRNPLRDQFSAFINSKFGYVPGFDLVRGIFQVFKKGDAYDLWKMGGGEHSMMVSLDRDYLQKTFKEVLADKKATTLKYVKNPIEALRILSTLTEEATRIGEMSRALKAGATPTEAAFASREVTLDFARMGAKTKAINSIIAFWNPTVQDLDKVTRTFKSNPIRTSVKILSAVTIPSILLYMANRDDPRWKEIPQWQKDLFWIIMTKDHIFRIPKPFIVGQLFGSVPERIMEYIDTGDSSLFGDLKKNVLSGLTPSWMPTALLPIVEDITNYSFFTDRPIVSRGQENLPASEQYGNFTSELSKLLGKELDYSPSKIDNLIQGYTGGLGKYAVQMIDEILAGTGITNPPPKPAVQLEDQPVLKAFMVRPPEGSSSESVNRIYKMNDDISKRKNLLSKMIKENDLEGAKKYAKENKDIVYAQLLSQAISTFNDINKVRNQIRIDKDLNPEDKQKKIHKLDDVQTKVAQGVLKEINK